MKQLTTVFLITLTLFALTKDVSAVGGQSENQTFKHDPSVLAAVAELSDEQARHLLIEKLNKEALAAKQPEENRDGPAVFIENIKNKIALIQTRIQYIKSGGKSAGNDMPGLFAYLGKGKIDASLLHSIWRVLLIFIMAYAVELLFIWYTRPFRNRFISDARVALHDKIIQLILRVVIDVIAALIFTVAAILCFHFFFETTYTLRLLLVAYLTAILAVRAVRIATRFLLVPKDPSLRILPIQDDIARYLYRWGTALSIFISFGIVTPGILSLTGANEAEHSMAVFMVTVIAAAMFMVMIFQKKQDVARFLSSKFPPHSQLAALMNKWHHFAIFSIFILLAVSTISILLGHFGRHLALKTILLVPFFFLMDWILCQVLEALFKFIPKDNETADDVSNQGDAGDSLTSESRKPMLIAHVGFNRMKKVLVSVLRISLLALFIIWGMNLWGIESPVGKAVFSAVFDILLVTLICYVVWEFLNAAIQRRLKTDTQTDDEDMEEGGGAGGSREHTLLVLVRKFLMIFIIVIATLVILSSIGVDIGPLIAGAGVFGLAIGFGAQTLVKDIISGIFFLMDDAFRVGDYIEIGNSKGLVEQISIRSLKLRHPRGMLNTLPFGDISSVTNFSRDYIITKLDFRVRYDTDVEKVRKLVKKKVYKVICDNEELGPKLLGKIKSTGVRQMDDSAMIMRIKYKTKPGDQFAIRKEVYRLLQEAFKQNGIEFAHKNVTVYMPPGLSEMEGFDDKDLRKKVAEAGAAATLEEPTPQE